MSQSEQNTSNYIIFLYEWIRSILGPADRKILYRGADKFLAPPTSRCVLFDSENISFDAVRVVYINSTNIPPIMIINSI
jgi:hypothetical protein